MLEIHLKLSHDLGYMWLSLFSAFIALQRMNFSFDGQGGLKLFIQWGSYNK